MLCYMAQEFEKLQARYDGLLDIVFLRDGGFAVCLPSHFSKDEMQEVTEYFRKNLDICPRMINVSQVGGFTPPRSP
jgi:hypothetical protein